MILRLFSILSLFFCIAGCIATHPVTEKKAFFQDSFESGALSSAFTLKGGRVKIIGEKKNRYVVFESSAQETAGLLFGPALSEGLCVGARFRTGESNLPSRFGIGLNGLSGYRLQINPKKNQLELYRDTSRVEAIDFDTSTNKWTHLRLQVRALPGVKWVIEGKAWNEIESEPKNWLLLWTDIATPETGQPGIWSSANVKKSLVEIDDLRVWLVED